MKYLLLLSVICFVLKVYAIEFNGRRVDGSKSTREILIHRRGCGPHPLRCSSPEDFNARCAWFQFTTQSMPADLATKAARS